jgi:N-carbamoylputrescine amidase
MAEESSMLTLGVVQFACTDDLGANLASATRLIRQAAACGANIVLVQELYGALATADGSNRL